jgi:hypothetical protein
MISSWPGALAALFEQLDGVFAFGFQRRACRFPAVVEALAEQGQEELD